MKSTSILILGGGTGGISVAARLRREASGQSITIVEPAHVHYYQPLWTLVGGGAAKADESQRPMESLIPSGVDWIRDSVSSIEPQSSLVTLQSGASVRYEWLIVATGLTLNWSAIAGSLPVGGSDGVHSIYTIEGCQQTYRALEEFKGGRAIFTFPPVPIKCAGAPQKIMYLADEVFRRNRVRDSTEIIYTTAGAGMFGVPLFKTALEKVVARKKIEPKYFRKLVSIDRSQKQATFESTDPKGAKEREVLSYDFIHVVPPMKPHAFVSQSPLAWKEGDQLGWMKVDRSTLQNPDFPNVFGIGDVTGVPNSKTGAAIRKMAPVVVSNLLSVMKGGRPTSVYDGYSSCPLVTGFGRVILAEFGYDGKLMPSFPLDPSKERRSMWFLKKYLLPKMYWHGMMKGRM